MDYSWYEWMQRVEGRLCRIEQLLLSLTFSEETVMKELDDLQAQVRQNTDAEQGAVTLLGQLSDLIKAAGTDPAKLQQLTSDLDASKQKLAEAIVANTPAAPNPNPAPGPAPGPTPPQQARHPGGQSPAQQHRRP